MAVEGTADIIVEKQRNGPTGTVHLAFKKEFCRFSNLQKVESAEPRAHAGPF
jgi:replicative DNA helicase